MKLPFCGLALHVHAGGAFQRHSFLGGFFVRLTGSWPQDSTKLGSLSREVPSGTSIPSPARGLVQLWFKERETIEGAREAEGSIHFLGVYDGSKELSEINSSEAYGS